MKTTTLISALFAAATALLSLDAHAGFSCRSYDGKSALELHLEENRRYPVALKDEQGESLFQAVATAVEESYLYSRYEYQLWNGNSDQATLTITSRMRMGRGGCGRGSCEPGGTRIITGKLLRHEAETYFSCVETSF